MSGASPALSPAQFRQYLAFLRKHHFTKAQRRAFNKRKAAGKHHQHGKHHAARIPHSGRVVGAAVTAMPGQWITGCNDTEPTCAAAAVANSLLARTGIRAGDDEILALHHAAGGGPAGVRVSDVLDVLAVRGLSGVRPARISAGAAGADLIVSIGPHAACVCGPGLITWGAMIPAAGVEADETWTIRWG